MLPIRFFRNNRICEQQNTINMVCCDSSYQYFALIEMNLCNRIVQNWPAQGDVLMNKYPRQQRLVMLVNLLVIWY